MVAAEEEAAAVGWVVAWVAGWAVGAGAEAVAAAAWVAAAAAWAAARRVIPEAEMRRGEAGDNSAARWLP